MLHTKHIGHLTNNIQQCWLSAHLCTPVQGVSHTHTHPPPLIFMAQGNPPLIRKCVSPRLMPMIKKLSWWLCTREATRVYTGLELHPWDKWVLPGRRSKYASSNKPRLFLFSLFLGAYRIREKQKLLPLWWKALVWHETSCCGLTWHLFKPWHFVPIVDVCA